MFKKILIANQGGIPVLRAFAPSREPNFLLFSREDAKEDRHSRAGQQYRQMRGGSVATARPLYVAGKGVNKVPK
jgi:hypothetical protein